MTTVDIRWALLRRTAQEWRISITGTSHGTTCGKLPDTPPDAPIEEAQRDLERHLRRYWTVSGELTWRQTEPDCWTAEHQPPSEAPQAS